MLKKGIHLKYILSVTGAWKLAAGINQQMMKIWWRWRGAVAALVAEESGFDNAGIAKMWSITLCALWISPRSVWSCSDSSSDPADAQTLRVTQTLHEAAPVFNTMNSSSCIQPCPFRCIHWSYLQIFEPEMSKKLQVKASMFLLLD